MWRGWRRLRRSSGLRLTKQRGTVPSCTDRSVGIHASDHLRIQLEASATDVDTLVCGWDWGASRAVDEGVPDLEDLADLGWAGF